MLCQWMENVPSLKGSQEANATAGFDTQADKKTLEQLGEGLSLLQTGQRVASA